MEENHNVPTLVIDNMPLSLYDRIQDLAKSQRRTPAATVLEVLEGAFEPRGRVWPWRRCRKNHS
jgi:hypothetical protein